MKPNNPPTILIAGGAGYIGSHANKILNKRGFETVVYDNLSRGHREFAKWGHFVLGDFFSDSPPVGPWISSGRRPLKRF